MAASSLGILHTLPHFLFQVALGGGCGDSPIQQMRKTRLRVINTIDSEVAKLGFHSGSVTGRVKQEE